jgi:hypothetical protein
MNVVYVVNVARGYRGDVSEDFHGLFRPCFSCGRGVKPVRTMYTMFTTFRVADTRSVDFRELGTSGGLAESDIMNDHEGGPADDGQGAGTSSACGLVLEVDR